MPLATSKIYEEAALRHIGTTYGTVSLEKIQALLMIGYHRWFRLQDPLGIADIKTAIEYAKAMGYQYEQDKTTNISNGQGEDTVVTSESRRRTFWSCAILDIYLDLMGQRPRSLCLDGVALRLPRTENAFLYGEDVKTGLPSEDEGVYETRRCDTHNGTPVAEEGGVSMSVKFVIQCGKVVDITRTQGRRYLQIQCDLFSADI
jgi:hypothetical protein